MTNKTKLNLLLAKFQVYKLTYDDCVRTCAFILQDDELDRDDELFKKSSKTLEEVTPILMSLGDEILETVAFIESEEE